MVDVTNEVMSPRYACEQLHGEQAQSQHDEEQQRIEETALRRKAEQREHFITDVHIDDMD